MLRRTLLRIACAGTGGAAVAILAGCGSGARLRLGQPASYTPPPPGIDEIYRTSLLSLINDVADAAQKFREADFAIWAEEADSARSLSASVLTATEAHTRALHTGAENSDEQAGTHAVNGTTGGNDRGQASDAGGAPQQGVIDDASVTLPLLAQALSLTARECATGGLQASGSLARLVSSIGAWSLWALAQAQRLAAAASIALPNDSTPAAVAPGALRTVPKTDPPAEAPAYDAAELLPRAQKHEWFSAYAYEVMAAQAHKDARAPLLAASTAHAERAKSYGEVALALGVEPQPREAGYALASTDRAALAALRTRINRESMEAAIVLTGASPFDARETFVSAWIAEAPRLAGALNALDPLPGLAQ